MSDYFVKSRKGLDNCKFCAIWTSLFWDRSILRSNYDGYALLNPYVVFDKIKKHFNRPYRSEAMELLTLVLVDDEPIILKGLLETYDWGNMGFRVVGAARDGEEALEMLKEKKPDLVLTDVRMKKMSGLTLIERAKELELKTNFVVISAYRDFEYAKKACENGALSYLVKPIDDGELEHTMRSIYEACTEKKFKEKNYDLWERILIEDRDNFLNQMVGKYLDNGLTESELIDFFSSMQREEELEHNFAVIAADIDITQCIVNQKEYDMQQYLLDTQLYKLLKEKYPIWTKKSVEGISCYIVELGEEKKLDSIKQILKQLREELNSDLISAISNVELGLKGLKKAYSQVVRLFEVASEAGAGMLTMNNETEVAVKSQYSLDIESQILGAIRKNDATQLKEAYKKFIYRMKIKQLESI